MHAWQIDRNQSINQEKINQEKINQEEKINHQSRR